MLKLSPAITAAKTKLSGFPMASMAKAAVAIARTTPPTISARSVPKRTTKAPAAAMPTNDAMRPDRAAHFADIDLGEADVVVERIGHRSHHEIGQLIERDRGQHQKREPAMGAEERDERSGDRIEDAAQRFERRFFQTLFDAAASPRLGSGANSVAAIPMVIATP